MPTVLLTAFEPYAEWATNASWLALVELTRELPELPRIITRRYPVDFNLLPQKLAIDLAANYDYALHLGQCPGAAWIRLEAVGGNWAAPHEALETSPLAPDGPPAYTSNLPLPEMA